MTLTIYVHLNLALCCVQSVSFDALDIKNLKGKDGYSINDDINVISSLSQTRNEN